jgi:4-diphosphocytidyl-2-C-methyl-D-erythritol kinase
LTTVTETAPAKINLYLHVLGRRPDGYHRLDSLVAFADIADAVSVSPAPALSLDVTGPFAAALGEPRGNLVWRAAEALAARIGGARGAAITLTKTLPVSSGIGGGSSDAAAALRALAKLWQTPADLREVALPLGADVPVCLVPRASWLGGVGEEVAPAPPLPEVAVVLANPGVALPTAGVFERRAGAFSPAARFDAPPQDAVALAALLAARRNDLTDAAVALVPEIGDVLRSLAAAPGTLLARMSGSGATCFALFAQRSHADAAAQMVAQEHPRWWARAGRLF